MLMEELADRLSFVGGEIVEDDVNLLPRRAQGYDFLEKGNELAAGVTGSGSAVDAAGGGIERRIQGERAVPVVLEAVTFGASGRERQDRIETIQGLNGGLRIDAEHGCVLRRTQIEAEDVRGFGFELGIVAGHVAFEAVGFQARFLATEGDEVGLSRFLKAVEAAGHTVNLHQVVKRVKEQKGPSLAPTERARTLGTMAEGGWLTLVL